MAKPGQFNYSLFRKEWSKNLENRRYRDCEKLCHDGLAKTPPDKIRGKLYNHLGYLYENFLEDKTFDDILEHYVLSLQVDESNASAHYNLSNFLLEQGMQHLLRALELNPKHDKAQKRLALLQPLKPDDILRLGGATYRCEEITEDGIHCRRVRLNAQGLYERTDEVADIEIGPGAGKMDGSRTGGPSGAGGTAQMGSMSVETDMQRRSAASSCCQKSMCALWCLFALLALVGVVAPLYGFFVAEDCDDTYQLKTETVNSADSLDVAFVLDCSDGLFYDEQTAAADALASALSTSISDLRVATEASCGLTSIEERALSSFSDGDTLTYPNATSSSGLLHMNVSLETCESLFAARSDADSERAFLCVSFVTMETPLSSYEALSLANARDSGFAEMYAAFVTVGDDVIPDEITSSLYGFLGAIGSTWSGTESDARQSWWDLTLDCDESNRAESATEVFDFCPHCMFYTEDGSSDYSGDFACNGELLAEAFTQGIESETYKKDGEKCELEDYYTYAVGAALPLIILTFGFLIHVSCRLFADKSVCLCAAA